MLWGKSQYHSDLLERRPACEWSQRSSFPRLSTEFCGEVATRFAATFAVTWRLGGKRESPDGRYILTLNYSICLSSNLYETAGHCHKMYGRQGNLVWQHQELKGISVPFWDGKLSCMDSAESKALLKDGNCLRPAAFSKNVLRCWSSTELASGGKFIQ